MAIEVGRNVLVPLDVSPSGVKATGSTATRSLQARFADVVNVKDYGATGDGVTDDTAAINAAFTFASSNQTVIFQRGTYIVSDTLNINGSNTVIGQGGQSTFLQWATGADGTGKAILKLRGRTITLRGLNLQGNATNAPDTGIDFYPDLALIAQMHVLEDVWVGTSNPPGVGLWSHNPPGGQQHEMIAIRNSRITGLDAGVLFDKIHEDLWSFANCYIGHTSASGASIRVASGANGMGLHLLHTWLIGPHFGIEFASGSQWDDIVMEASGAEGPATSLEITGASPKVTILGQGLGAPAHVATTYTLTLRSSHAQFFTTTAGAKTFVIDAGAAVVWDSFRDKLYLDSIIQLDPDTFAAQAKSGAGNFSFAAAGTYRRRIEVPTRFGGNGAWFYTPGTPMLEAQTLYNTSPIARFTKVAGGTLVEITESLGSTGQPGMILNGVRMFSGTAAPGGGTWAVGDIIWNTAPAAGGTPGWVCTEAGSPGVWKAMANLAA